MKSRDSIFLLRKPLCCNGQHEIEQFALPTIHQEHRYQQGIIARYRGRDSKTLPSAFDQTVQLRISVYFSYIYIFFTFVEGHENSSFVLKGHS